MSILQVLTNVYTYDIRKCNATFTKKSKIVTLFENVLWRPSLIFWGIKNNIAIRVFRFADLKNFYCRKRTSISLLSEFIFQGSRISFTWQIFSIWLQILKYLFHQDTFQRLLLYFENKKINNFTSRSKWKFIISP